MEKRKPHYDLDSIKATFLDVASLRLTITARNCAFHLGLSLKDVVDIIQTMTRQQLYKSMTSQANTAIWQDVYYVPCGEMTLYVKFTTDPMGYLLISFKEKDEP